jgi:hypothetical protein
MSIGLGITPDVDIKIRAAVQNAIDRCADMRVHLYRRYFTSKALFTENSTVTTSDGQRVRAAMVYRTSNTVKDIREEKGGVRRANSRAYDYEVLLYVGLKDEENTEAVLNDIMDALMREFDGDTFLAELVALNCLPEPASVPTVGHALWFDVLCNQCQIRITITEYY